MSWQAHSTEHPTQCVGAVVGKLEQHKYNSKRGYIAMLAVEKNFRRRRIGKALDFLVDLVIFCLNVDVSYNYFVRFYVLVTASLSE